MRNVYSPDVACAARADRRPARRRSWARTRYQFRRDFLQRRAGSGGPRAKVAEVGSWGRSMPAGIAQGIAFHTEYKAVSAALVEIDCRPADGQPPDPRRRHRPAGHQGRLRGRRRPRRQPARAGGPDDGRHHGRHRAGADLEPAPARRPLPRSQLGQLLLHPAVEHPARAEVIVMPTRPPTSRAARASSASPPSMAAVACAYGRATGTMPTYFPINHGDPLAFTPSRPSRRSRRRPPTACNAPAEPT